MEIISFTNPNAVTKMEQAVVVNGITSKTWIERYSTAGEFTFIGPVSTGLKEILSIGSFVSHTDSDDLMIVENQEINADSGNLDPDITITGRSFETYLEQRVVGANMAFPLSDVDGVVDYSLISEHTWNQAVTMIEDHILASALIDDTYQIPWVTVLSTVVPLGTETPETARTVKRGDLYNAVLDLLKIDNHGITVVRPGSTSPLGPTDPNLAIVVHSGTDLTGSVSLSQASGEVVNADYLWSNKSLKNAALVTGKWVEMKVDPISSTEYGIRMMYIDGSDLDKDLTAAPTGTDLDAVVNAMNQLGREALLSQRELVLNKAETAKSGLSPMYRRDYFIGDLITVNGEFNETTTMRVSEHVEIEDSTGVSSYPTLTVDGIAT